MGDEVEPAEIFAISESTLKKTIRLDGCQVADWIVGERAKGRATETEQSARLHLFLKGFNHY